MYDIRPMPEQIPAELIARLLRTDTGTIGHFLDAGIMDPGMQARMPGAKIAGTAITVQVTVPDSLAAHYALKFTRPGDILVIERGVDQRTACWGGTTSAGAVRGGLAGLIMDGAGNDIREANAAGLPIWCRHVTPITTKHRVMGGAVNVPISCGGVAVMPGDGIIADDNGIIVIPRDQVEWVADEAIKFRKLEDDLLDFLRDNPDIPYPDASGVSAKVEAELKKQQEQT